MQSQSNSPGTRSLNQDGASTDAWTELQLASDKPGPAANFDGLYDGYASVVLGQEHHLYSALEIHGVRQTALSAGGMTFEIDEQRPDFMSVYARRCEGGVECIGDFGKHAWARSYAESISKQYGWPVYDFTVARLN